MIRNLGFTLLVLMLSTSTSCFEVPHLKKLTSAGAYCTPPSEQNCYNDPQYGQICYCYTVSPQINPPKLPSNPPSENKPQPPPPVSKPNPPNEKKPQPTPVIAKPNPPVEKKSPPPIVKQNPPFENKSPPPVTKPNPPSEKKSPPPAPVVSKPNPPVEKKPPSPPVAKLNPPSPKKPEPPVKQQPKVPNRWDFCQISPRDFLFVKLRKQCWCSLHNSDTCFVEIWKASFYDSMEISKSCCDAYWAVEEKCHGYMFEWKNRFAGYKLKQLCSQYY